MTTTEAMKLALDALKRMKGYGNTFAYRSHEQNPHEQVCEAITALEALASEAIEQKSGIKQVIELYDSPDQPSPATPLREWEPVAYMGTDSDGNPNKFRLNPFSGCVSLYEKPSPVQKPVAYMDICEKNQMSGLRYWSEPDNRHEVPLYTSPPAQRTWVGLTKSEITTSLPYSVTRDKGCFHAGALWAEAKLKEKNT